MLFWVQLSMFLPFYAVYMYWLFFVQGKKLGAHEMEL